MKNREEKWQGNAKRHALKKGFEESITAIKQVEEVVIDKIDEFLSFFLPANEEEAVTRQLQSLMDEGLIVHLVGELAPEG